MPKLKTVHAFFDGSTRGELQFKYDVYVNQEGEFTTTIPQDIAEMFEAAGFYMSTNQLKNKGFFKSDSFDDLCKKVAKVAEDYMSKQLIEEIIVIRYNIVTTCSYWKNADGTIQPNGAGANGGGWKEGTETQHAASPHPFGIQIYAEPFVRRKYLFRNGREKIDYIRPSRGNISEATGEPMIFSESIKELGSFASMTSPRGGKMQDIPYTESVAQFFLNLLYSMCNLNEKIKDFITPEAIQLLADKKMNLLGGTSNNQ